MGGDGEVCGEELGGSKLAKRLVGADVVVGVLPTAQVMGEAGDSRGGVRAVVELLAVGTVGTFDAAVELGAAGREFEEQDAVVAAGILELGHELGAAVDLDRPDGKRAALDECLERLGGEIGR